MNPSVLFCGAEVRLLPNALYSDRIPVPERFWNRRFTVLSFDEETALLSSMRRHVLLSCLAPWEW